MEYMTVEETATEWGISERRVLTLCTEGRVDGAEKFGWSWAIPLGTQKPSDARRREEFRLEFDTPEQPSVRIERVWAMPSSRTFEIKPIRELILDEMLQGLWIDPFANRNKLANVTNDLNPEFDTDYHLDALDFLKMFEDDSVDGVLYDPPYSPRQVSECYNDVGYNVTWDTTKAAFWANHKREISRILKKGGKVITFGWNSGGIGMKNGFEITRILLVPHGGWHNDTICTVEIKRSKTPLPSNQISLSDYAESVKIQLTETDGAIIAKLESLPIDFWDFKTADTREYTHRVHNYPAVMVSPISRNILKLMKQYCEVETLLDPFSGSGTVLVEGVVADVNKIIGNDLNPLARLMSEVKTHPIPKEKLQEIYNRLMMVVEFEMGNLRFVRKCVDDYITSELGLDITAKDGWGSDAPKLLTDYLEKRGFKLTIPDFKNIGYWYKPQILIDLQIIKNCIAELPNGAEKDFVWIAFSEITRVVSNRRNDEFKMFRMPTDKILKFVPNVKREFADLLQRNIEKVADLDAYCASNGITPNVTVLSENTMELGSVEGESVDLMITSPPYGDSRTTVAYGEFSKLSLQWLDLEQITREEICNMDRRLMGGSKFRNGFEFTLDSPTLRKSLEVIKASDIERAGDVYSFYRDLDFAIAAIAKKMKRGGYQFWVVGNRTVKLENLQTDQILIELSSKYGLAHIYSVGRNIPNKVMPSLNSPTNEAGKKVTTMTNEHIVIFRKL
jgi:DNA modification methylase